ncbi:hypothetical protein SAMN05518865_1213 [Duganella sp. CF458]|nr:hypothetical protein SAMN05518865_1213 [Duganella sp. CF458]
MHQCPKYLLLFALTHFAALHAFASVPPDLKEPTRAELRELGFKYKIRKGEVNSTIDLHFPENVRAGQFALAPYITEIVVKDSAGEVIAESTNWISDNRFKTVVASYNHKVSDVAISITYACTKRGENGCYGATTISIPSVSKFINANPDLVNLRPKCRNVTSTVVDCTKYEHPEYP